MNDQYLWDKSGEPDSGIVELEEMLSVYREKPRCSVRRTLWPRFFSIAGIAAAAALVLLQVLPKFLLQELSGWTVTMDQDHPRQVRLGDTIRTGSRSVSLHDSAIGDIDLLPGSKLEVARRLSLREGTMHAFIWAPPAKFAVETPSARAVDLGCEYTLSVEPDGSGLVRVQIGWVAFQKGSTESFIPAGAACRTRLKDGPGLPYFEDAGDAFISALTKGDVGGMLAEARQKDALTLWHIMQRTPPANRARVVERFVQLVPGADATALTRGDSQAMDNAWNELGLGNTDWWRVWKRSW